MKRRTFLRTGAAAVAASTALAGCTGDNSPPPRKSDVFKDVAAQDGQIAVEFDHDIVVETRADVDGSAALVNPLSLLGGLSPIGVAAAKGRGATGRGAGGYSSAPKTGHGHAKWHGGAYAGGWRDDHDDEIQMHNATVALAGAAYLGTNESYEENPPGAGPVEWDETWSNPSPTDDTTGNKTSANETDDGSTAVPETFEGTEINYDATKVGWHRIGTKLTTPDGDHVFGWEAVDFRVVETTDGYSVEKTWKISPRL